MPYAGAVRRRNEKKQQQPQNGNVLLDRITSFAFTHTYRAEFAIAWIGTTRFCGLYTAYWPPFTFSFSNKYVVERNWRLHDVRIQQLRYSFLVPFALICGRRTLRCCAVYESNAARCACCSRGYRLWHRVEVAQRNKNRRITPRTHTGTQRAALRVARAVPSPRQR